MKNISIYVTLQPSVSIDILHYLEKRKMKILLLILFLFSGALLMTHCRHTSDSEIQPVTDSKDNLPNIVFLLADDQRFDALGVAGNPIIKTKSLDSLADNGLYFTNANVTSSICCISRASILSGQYARRHKIWDFNSNFTATAFEDTYPMLLKKAGYKTGFIGKFGVGNNAPGEKFDFWRGFNGQGNYITKDAEGKPIHILKLNEQEITTFINQYGTGKTPFFLQVSFKAPHAQDENPAGEEFVFDPSYSGFYNGIKWELPEAAKSQYFNYFPKIFTDKNEARARWQKRFSSPGLISKTMGGYYRLIQQMDDVTGSLMAQLRQKNLDKNTIIIYASDNGYYLGEYGFADKWYGSQPSIRVPLIIYDPRKNAPHGIRSPNLALNIDIAPTILNFAHITPPSKMQGQSLAQPNSIDDRKDFFYEHLWTDGSTYIPSTEGVVSSQYKYMRYFKGMDSTHLIFEELYDLKNDPNEIDNLSNKPENEIMKNSMKNRLWALKKEVQ